MSGFDPGLRFSFFLVETLSITGQIFLSVVKLTVTVYERDSCRDDLNRCLLFEVIKSSFVIKCNNANVLVP